MLSTIKYFLFHIRIFIYQEYKLTFQTPKIAIYNKFLRTSKGIVANKWSNHLAVLTKKRENMLYNDHNGFFKIYGG